MRQYLTKAFLILFLFSCKTGKNVEWIQTNKTDSWKSSEFVTTDNNCIINEDAVIIDTSIAAQFIDGFGGCFNELGWEALNKVTEGEKKEIIHQLFDTIQGCKFNICRVPIGANDYAVDWYSHDEVDGDYSMEHFSIARDQKQLIPYIKTAQKFRPKLKVWASPWCPPSWMKVNKHYACHSDKNENDLSENLEGQEMVDQFIMAEDNLSAYALYFSKFVQAYLDEGINLYAVHVQNEPNSCQNFPSCIWTPQSLAVFIGKHLGPQLRKDLPQTEIWLGTIERPQPERVDIILQDDDAKQYLKGVGFQWAGKGVIAHVHETYPELKLMQTETECGDGSNDWKAMEHTFELMKHYFENGANAYMYWNMVLDHTGKSQWGWKQNSMITITEDFKIVYNPEFYLMKHLSYFILPGARYIPQKLNNNCMVFMNPDRELIIVYYNDLEETVEKCFDSGGTLINVSFPPKSIHTLKVQL